MVNRLNENQWDLMNEENLEISETRPNRTLIRRMPKSSVNLQPNIRIVGIFLWIDRIHGFEISQWQALTIPSILSFLLYEICQTIREKRKVNCYGKNSHFTHL